MRRLSRLSPLVVLAGIGAIVTLAACRGSDTTAPAGPDRDATVNAIQSVVATTAADTPVVAVTDSAIAQAPGAAQPVAVPTTLLTCSVAKRSHAVGVIGPTGGVLRTGNSYIRFPVGAVPDPTEFTITEIDGAHFRVDVTATNIPHYRFQKPVVIGIDYHRCRSQVDALSKVGVWYVADDATLSLLEYMGGHREPAEARVVFQTWHLSGYIVAGFAGTGDDSGTGGTGEPTY